MRTTSLVLLLFASALAGCMSLAYPPQPRNFDRGLEALAQLDYEVAYRFLEQPSPGTEGEVLQLMKQKPELLAAAEQTFSPQALPASIARYGRAESFRIEHSRLQRFSVYSSAERFEVAATTFAALYPQELVEYHAKEAERARVARLPEAEQQAYWAEAFRRSVEAVTVRGVILSAQHIDESPPGTRTGAALGAAIGQAAYIDSSSWRTYRASSQLAAGLLGAMLGSALDQRPTKQYLKVYYVRTPAGETKRIDERAKDAILLPVGACIEYREPFHLVLAPDNLCAAQR
jgi:hypothetical protein